MAAGHSGAAEAAARRFAAAHQAMLRTRGLQLDFTAAPKPEPPPHWLLVLGRAIAAATPVLKWFFWIGVAVGVAAIVWIVIRDLPFAARLGRRRKRTAVETAWRPEETAARALLEDADRLAQEGRFADAIHLILFRSIDDIAAKRPGSVRAALTSRDIVQAAPLSDEGRRAFRRIADAVERSFFGGQGADAGEFASCRQAYEAFAFSEGSR